MIKILEHDIWLKKLLSVQENIIELMVDEAENVDTINELQWLLLDLMKYSDFDIAARTVSIDFSKLNPKLIDLFSIGVVALIKEHKKKYPILWKSLELSELDLAVLDVLYFDICNKYQLSVADSKGLRDIIAEQSDIVRDMPYQQYTIEILHNIKQLYKLDGMDTVIAVLIEPILDYLITLTE